MQRNVTMSNKSKEIKNNRPKKWVSRTMIAHVVGCGNSTVSSIFNGKRNPDTDLAQRIEVAEMLLSEGVEKAIEDVKKIVKK